MDEDLSSNGTQLCISRNYFDLNELPKEAQMDEDFIANETHQSDSRNYIELDESQTSNNEKNSDNCGEKVLEEYNFEPFVGQCFLSEEETFIFYTTYARQHGFSIRKGRFVTKNKEIVRWDFFCHRAGKPPLKIVDPSKEQRNRESLKCRCKAHLRIALRKSFDIFPQEWHVTKFIIDHNHELLAPSEVRFLPSNRIITKEDEDRIQLLKEANLSIRQIMRIMELKKKVEHEHLSFFQKDIRNLFEKMRREHATSDAMNLLQYCKDAKEENSKFQYAFKIDNERKLEHIFWAPYPCIDW